MGRKSTKPDKNIFQLSREAAGLTRDQASEKMEYISADRIEKIESERLMAHPEDVLEMAKCYKDSSLRNHYCSTMCPLGKGHIHKLENKALSKITIEMLASLNALEAQKNRFIEIIVDDEISEDEYEDFTAIKKQLEKMSASIESLNILLEQMSYEGKIDIDKVK